MKLRRSLDCNLGRRLRCGCLDTRALRLGGRGKDRGCLVVIFAIQLLEARSDSHRLKVNVGSGSWLNRHAGGPLAIDYGNVGRSAGRRALLGVDVAPNILRPGERLLIDLPTPASGLTYRVYKTSSYR